ITAMTASDRKVYDLVRRRYLAQFYPVHEFDQTTVAAVFAGEQFTASGRALVKTGWRAVYSEPVEPAEEGSADEEGTARLPKLAVGDALRCLAAEVRALKTAPPPSYTEGTLLKAMKSIGRLVNDPRLKQILRETAGIGTNATRAGIIETLVQRGLIERKGK